MALLGGASAMSSGWPCAHGGRACLWSFAETRLILLPVILGVAAAVATVGSLAATAPDCAARSRAGLAR